MVLSTFASIYFLDNLLSNNQVFEFANQIDMFSIISKYGDLYKDLLLNEDYHLFLCSNINNLKSFCNNVQSTFPDLKNDSRAHLEIFTSKKIFHPYSLSNCMINTRTDKVSITESSPLKKRRESSSKLSMLMSCFSINQNDATELLEMIDLCPLIFDFPCISE